MGTSRPSTEGKISSMSGSPTVKTRTSGRATQRFTVLEVALRCGSKINSRKKGLSELHGNPAREAARQASGTDRRSPGACGSWQSFAPFPFFPSTAPETCATASARGGDGGKKIHWLPPAVQGAAAVPRWPAWEGVFLAGGVRGSPWHQRWGQPRWESGQWSGEKVMEQRRR